MSCSRRKVGGGLSCPRDEPIDHNPCKGGIVGRLFVVVVVVVAFAIVAIMRLPVLCSKRDVISVDEFAAAIWAVVVLGMLKPLHDAFVVKDMKTFHRFRPGYHIPYTEVLHAHDTFRRVLVTS
jgi:hypothetical protein